MQRSYGAPRGQQQLSQPPRRLEGKDRAAAVIQKYYRGYLARKAYTRLKAATRTIQAHARGWYTRKKVLDAREKAALEERFQATMARHRERIYMLEKHKRLVQAQPAQDIDIWHNKRTKAAARIQAAWRGYVQRKIFARMDPERAKREAASLQIQKAFKSIMAKAQAAHKQQQHSDLGLSQEYGLASSSTPAHKAQQSPGTPNGPRGETLPPEARMSATVLMGSPPKGAVGTPPDKAAAGGGKADAQTANAYWTTRNQHMMSGKRYAELRKQVEARVHMHKAQATHKRPDTHTVDTRLQALLQEYHASAGDRLAAAHARAAQVVALEALAGDLDNGGLRPLAQLDNPNPADFPRPAKGSERWERALHAHAAELADARAGSAWWRLLKPLARSNLQRALLQEDQDRWTDMEAIWRRNWQRLEAAEARRPDPLAELGIRAQNAPKPTLSDIAVRDTDPASSQQQPSQPSHHTSDTQTPARDQAPRGQPQPTQHVPQLQDKPAHNSATTVQGHAQQTAQRHGGTASAAQPTAQGKGQKPQAAIPAHATAVNTSVKEGEFGAFVVPK